MQCLLSRSFTICLNINSRCLLRRILHNNAKSLLKTAKEIEIKVPWGKVAGKLWGSENQQPMLALHGWQDNAGSFNALAPFLSKNIPIMAIDFPGHGLSSWLPPGIMYDIAFYIILIERLRQYFEWDKIKIIGHSMGGYVILWYSYLFTKQIKYTVIIDGLRSLSSTKLEYNNTFSKIISKFLETEKFVNKLTYTQEEIMNRWISATENSLNEVSCKMLMKRGVTQVEHGKYVINRDPRLKVVPNFSQFVQEELHQCTENVTFPFLLITAKNSHIGNMENASKIFNIMKEKNENVYWEEITGTHHVHMRDAETVANIINPFLKKYDR
ncbi:serine hydrolase-like protein isoform X2 [Ptiloglossa arizonensis]|uniref:serine hydrolase-like protein isoform X2 n=1 Tax=Ptiloglossa arizonensis TaxID=3350558 RepID=UPI003FA046FF